MKRLIVFIPPLEVAAYTALVLAVVTFGVAIAALAISLVALLNGGPYA